MGKKTKLRSQFMGKINSIGFELRSRGENKYEVYLVFELRLDRVTSQEEAQDRIQKLKGLIGSDAVLFAP